MTQTPLAGGKHQAGGVWARKSIAALSVRSSRDQARGGPPFPPCRAWQAITRAVHAGKRHHLVIGSVNKHHRRCRIVDDRGRLQQGTGKLTIAAGAGGRANPAMKAHHAAAAGQGNRIHTKIQRRTGIGKAWQDTAAAAGGRFQIAQIKPLPAHRVHAADVRDRHKSCPRKTKRHGIGKVGKIAGIRTTMQDHNQADAAARR